MEKKIPVTIKEDEKYLRQVSTPVAKNDPALGKDIEILERYCKENPVLAMAAIQLRIPKRLVYVRNSSLEMVEKKQNGKLTEKDENYDEAKILINPVIIKREGLTEYWEACVSCLNKMGLVKRPYKIVLEYEDLNRKKHIEEWKGFEATVLSHELDHLDGILHIDIAEKVLEMEEKDRKEFRKTHGYNIIKKTGAYKEQ